MKEILAISGRSLNCLHTYCSKYCYLYWYSELSRAASKHTCKCMYDQNF